MDILIEGRPATPYDLAHQALVNYGAYTSFRVEQGAVRGLDLHLARLEQAAVELFGESPGRGGVASSDGAGRRGPRRLLAAGQPVFAGDRSSRIRRSSVGRRS